MNTASPSYVLAEHIHDTFFGNNDILNTEELQSTGVRRTVGSTSSNTSQRIEVMGKVKGELVSQTLAKDIRGDFHLSTTYRAEGGNHIQINIRPNSSLEALEVLANTLFMEKLVEVEYSRDA